MSFVNVSLSLSGEIDRLLFLSALFQMSPVVCLHQLNKKLTCELEVVKQRLEISQSELHELTAKKVTNTSQVPEREAERAQPLGRKERLPGSMSDGGHAELTEMREKYCQLR